MMGFMFGSASAGPAGHRFVRCMQRTLFWLLLLLALLALTEASGSGRAPREGGGGGRGNGGAGKRGPGRPPGRPRNSGGSGRPRITLPNFNVQEVFVNARNEVLRLLATRLGVEFEDVEQQMRSNTIQFDADRHQQYRDAVRAIYNNANYFTPLTVANDTWRAHKPDSFQFQKWCMSQWPNVYKGSSSKPSPPFNRLTFAKNDIVYVKIDNDYTFAEIQAFVPFEQSTYYLVYVFERWRRGHQSPLFWVPAYQIAVMTHLELWNLVRRAVGYYGLDGLDNPLEPWQPLQYTRMCGDLLIADFPFVSRNVRPRIMTSGNASISTEARVPV